MKQRVVSLSDFGPAENMSLIKYWKIITLYILDATFSQLTSLFKKFSK